jgi:V8-like Glu-specific endopeptidase
MLLWTAILIAAGSCARPNAPSRAVPPEETPGKIRATGIYGFDDRHDVFEESNPVVRQLADSTVAIINTSDLNPQANGSVIVNTRLLGEAQSLCPDERFREQDTAPFCSGFLISPNTIVTAGHCVSDETDCAQISVAFGYALATASSSVKGIESSEIYKCARLLYAEVPKKNSFPKPLPGQPNTVPSGPDFSIFQLDRPVLGHLPLRWRNSGTPELGTKVFVIGHPSGLPTKIAGGAKIRKLSPPAYFTTNLDAYGGNSGSPVFAHDTLEVEGILVRGGSDYIYQSEQRCRSSVRCPDDQCRGEDVMSITEIVQHLKKRN